METFTASTNERHTTDLAMLRGARMVTAQETDEGRKWAEAKIKALTGGDPVTARFMHQNNFTFIPQFKLLIAGNHKPGLRAVDDAIRRRLHMIPFNAKITAEERDPELQEKLKAEWPGILAWAVAGCLAWQQQGLDAPEAVTKATEEYLESEDAIALWIEAHCVVGANHTAGSSELYRKWMFWAEEAGERGGSQKRFSQALVMRGFKSTRQSGGKAAFAGISLIPSAPGTLQFLTRSAGPPAPIEGAE